MRDRFLHSTITLVLAAAAVGAVISVSITGTSAQAPAGAPAGAPAPVSMLKTPWGEPNLQGIWTDETDTPLERSPKFANQEIFTAAQRADLDRQRSAMLDVDPRA